MDESAASERPSVASVEAYARYAVDSGMYGSAPRLLTLLRRTFAGVELRGSRVLDIGGGTGLLSLYAAVAGAREVVCLEPELDGSSRDMVSTFRAAANALGCTAASVQTETFQEYEAGESAFDVLILYNSINHLDERACIRLRSDPAARQSYARLFTKLASVAADGAHLLLADCSPINLFPCLHIRNPFAPAIEWHKHQKPAVWRDMLIRAGFEQPCIRWTPPNCLGRAGVLLGNGPAAFLFQSHFCLSVRRSPRARARSRITDA